MKEYVKDAAGKEWRIEDLNITGNPAEEQEYVINAAPAVDDYVTIYTSHNPTLTKLKKLLQDDGSKYSLYRVDTMQGAICGVTVRGPLLAITFRSKKTEIKMTEEQRQAASLRLAAFRGQK